MRSIEAIRRLISVHPPVMRTRLRALVRAFSQWLVLNPNRFYVVGEISDDLLPSLLKRIEWFYFALESCEVAVQRPSGWWCYSMRRGLFGEPTRLGGLGAFRMAVEGKILVHDYTARWLKLDLLFNHKVFVVNWTREHRTSSWRFAASVARRPLALFGAGEMRQDDRKRSADVVVVGNGPSAYRVFDRQFDGMDVIVCNTAIKSKRLLAERKVVALGFIDAAFFVGPSKYCEAFYKALDEAVRLHDFSVYIDHEHEACVRQRTPSLKPERVFPVFLNGAVPLRANFNGVRAQCTSNSVFTSILIPLAATFYRRVHLVGFDGKDPNMKNYFWKHSDEFQFNDLLPTVKESDPGFFSKRDYDEYNRRNAEEVEAFISCIESAGVKVVMTHPSFIEPLQRRYQENKDRSLVGAMS